MSGFCSNDFAESYCSGCFYISSTIRIVKDDFSVPIHTVGLRAYILIGDENINCVGFLIRYRRWSYSQINDSSSY